MKNLVFVCLTIVFLSACKDSAPPRYASASPEIDVVKALLKDYEEGNWEGWMSHYADTAKLHHNSKEPSTAAQIRDGLSGILDNVSNYDFEDDDNFFEMVVDDDGEKWVNFWGNWEGTLSANNKTMSIPVHLTLQFVDGKIVEEHAYYDLSKYLTEMNAIHEAAMESEESMEE